MKKLPLFILIFLAGKFSFAQQELSKEKISELSALSAKLAGTYQIQIINSREMATVPLELFEIIQNKRQVTDTTYYNLKPNIQVMILPKNIIEKPGFEKLVQTIHISK